LRTSKSERKASRSGQGHQLQRSSDIRLREARPQVSVCRPENADCLAAQCHQVGASWRSAPVYSERPTPVTGRRFQESQMGRQPTPHSPSTRLSVWLWRICPISTSWLNAALHPLRTCGATA
jgi:hypothetical protein